jgi:hypothetical protein
MVTMMILRGKDKEVAIYSPPEFVAVSHGGRAYWVTMFFRSGIVDIELPHDSAQRVSKLEDGEYNALGLRVLSLESLLEKLTELEDVVSAL